MVRDENLWWEAKLNRWTRKGIVILSIFFLFRISGFAFSGLSDCFPNISHSCLKTALSWCICYYLYLYFLIRICDEKRSYKLIFSCVLSFFGILYHTNFWPNFTKCILLILRGMCFGKFVFFEFCKFCKWKESEAHYWTAILELLTRMIWY